MTEVEKMDGRKIPTRWEMESLEPEDMGKRPVLKIEKIDFNVKIEPQLFTEKNLTRRDRDW
ncbi:MAG: outer membrane lipoprotein-sorting protein [bacterium]